MKNILCLLCLVWLGFIGARAQDTLSYFRFQPGEDGTAEFKLANYIHPKVEFALIRRGVGALRRTAKSKATFLAQSSTVHSFEEAYSQNNYLEVVLKAKPDQYVSLSHLFASLILPKTGAVQYRWMYSLDNGNNFYMLKEAQSTKNLDEDIGLWEKSLFRNIGVKGEIMFRLYVWSAKSGDNFSYGFTQRKPIDEFALVLKGNISDDKPPGVTINHVPKYKKYYIGGPSICILPDGTYLASHDYFGPNKEARQDGLPITLIFRSEDKGMTWTFLQKIVGAAMSNLFYHAGNVYLLGVKAHDQEVVIRKSADNGYTWTNPIDSKNGLLKAGKFHTAPTPVVFHNGRVYRAMEDNFGEVQRWPTKYRPFIMSAPDSVDLLNASNWTFSNSLPYLVKEYLGGYGRGWIEGNAVVAPDGTVKDVLRIHSFDKKRERVAVADLDSTNTTLSFDAKNCFHDFPGGMKKFTIRYDSVSHTYYSLANYVKPEYQGVIPLDRVRNQLYLVASKDLKKWDVKKEILFHPDTLYHGFQYVDFQFEKDDIIFVSRTAYEDGIGGADSHHNSNYLTFHRISNFREP